MNRIILDVRESEEFAQNHVEGAINIPIHQIPQRLDELDKDAQIITYCNFGGRGGRAKSLLEELGFNNVANGINQENIEKNILNESKT